MVSRVNHRVSFSDITSTHIQLDAFSSPYIGGTLARPHERFPNSEFFSQKFWIEYPYSLPCIATAGWALMVLITFMGVLENARRQHRASALGRSGGGGP